MMERKINVRVQRFNPSLDKEPRFQAFEVLLIPGTSVLSVLDFIRENLDSTLAYYNHSACYRGVCARCMLVVNGKASLGCQTRVTGDITVETPKGFKILRDLAYATK